MTSADHESGFAHPAPLVRSPGGWRAPAGSRPGWNWLPPAGAAPRFDLLPVWLQVAVRLPFVDRYFHTVAWSRGGFGVQDAEPGSGREVLHDPDASTSVLASPRRSGRRSSGGRRR